MAEKLSDYFTLKQLLDIKREYEDSKEYFDSVMGKAIENDMSIQEVWEEVLGSVRHNNNFTLDNKDQAREISETGTTEYLDILCGDFTSNGYVLDITLSEFGGTFYVSDYFSLDKLGEDYLLDGFTMKDLDDCIKELKDCMTKGIN